MHPMYLFLCLAFLLVASVLSGSEEAKASHDPLFRAPEKKKPPALIPPFVDFGSKTLCQAFQEDVIIVNADPRNNLTLFSIKSLNPEFHFAWFRDEHVPPGKNTTFTVIYLPRMMGKAEGIIRIGSSHGDITYEVSGLGVDNALGVRPMTTGRVHATSVYLQPLLIYNTLPRPFMITEIFTSSPEIELEMSPLHEEGTQALSNRTWEIGPHVLRVVVVVKVSGGDVPRHVEGYINLKTNDSEASLIVPVEVEFTHDYGLFMGPGDGINFGTVFYNMKETVPLSLTFKGAGYARLNNFTMYNCWNRDPRRKCPSFQLSYDSKEIHREWTIAAMAAVNSYTSEPITGTFNGTFMLHYTVYHDGTTSQSSILVPFIGFVLDGYLDFSEADSTYFGSGPPFTDVRRVLPFVNRLEHPLLFTLLSLSSEASPYVTIEKYPSEPIMPGGNSSITLLFRPNATDLSLKGILNVRTNATYSLFQLPLYFYNGLLKYTTGQNESDVLDFSQSTSFLNPNPILYVHIWNPNPVKVPIYFYHSSLEKLSVIYQEKTFINAYRDLVTFSILHSNLSVPEPTVMHRLPLSTKRELNVSVDPGFVATFSVELSAEAKGRQSSEILFLTPYQEIRVPVVYGFTKNTFSVQPMEITFPPFFPLFRPDFDSMLPSVEMELRSSVAEVVLLPPEIPDYRFIFSPSPLLEKSKMTVPKNSTVLYGRLRFDPAIYMDPAENYLCPESSLPSLDDLSLPFCQQIPSLKKNWVAIKDKGADSISSNFTVRSEGEKGLLVGLRASLIYPEIASARSITFKKTPIGTNSTEKFELKNPSPYPLWVQLVNARNLSDENLRVELWKIFENQYLDPTPLITNVGLFSPETYDPIIIPPFSTRPVMISFSPLSHEPSASVLYLYNNLTIFEQLYITGAGLSGDLSVITNNQEAGITVTSRSIEYSVRRDLMQFCRNFTETDLTRTFSFNISFLNRGNAPLDIQYVGIQKSPCHYHAFSVSPCGAMTVAENAILNVTITYSPEYSSTLIKKDLIFAVNGQPFFFTFPLELKFPRDLVTACFNNQPRPAWEYRFKLGTLVIVIAIGLIILLVELKVSQSFSSPASSSKASAKPSKHSLKEKDPRDEGASKRGSLIAGSSTTEEASDTESTSPDDPPPAQPPAQPPTQAEQRAPSPEAPKPKKPKAVKPGARLETDKSASSSPANTPGLTRKPTRPEQVSNSNTSSSSSLVKQQSPSPPSPVPATSETKATKNENRSASQNHLKDENPGSSNPSKDAKPEVNPSKAQPESVKSKPSKSPLPTDENKGKTTRKAEPQIEAAPPQTQPAPRPAVPALSPTTQSQHQRKQGEQIQRQSSAPETRTQLPSRGQNPNTSMPATQVPPQKKSPVPSTTKPSTTPASASNPKDKPLREEDLKELFLKTPPISPTILAPQTQADRPLPQQPPQQQQYSPPQQYAPPPPLQHAMSHPPTSSWSKPNPSSSSPDVFVPNSQMPFYTQPPQGQPHIMSSPPLPTWNPASPPRRARGPSTGDMPPLNPPAMLENPWDDPWSDVAPVWDSPDTEGDFFNGVYREAVIPQPSNYPWSPMTPNNGLQTVPTTTPHSDPFSSSTNSLRDASRIWGSDINNSWGSSHQSLQFNAPFESNPAEDEDLPFDPTSPLRWLTADTPTDPFFSPPNTNVQAFPPFTSTNSTHSFPPQNFNPRSNQSPNNNPW